MNEFAVIHEPFALLGLWLDATHPDNAAWDSAKLIDVIIEEYSKVSLEEVLQVIREAGLDLKAIELEVS